MATCAAVTSCVRLPCCSYRVRIYRSGELVYTRTQNAPTVSHTETDLDLGMYTVKVAAVSANGVAGEEATVGPLTVGKPGKLAAAPTTQGGIGNLTLTWLKPEADPDPPSTLFFAMVGGRSKAAWPGAGGGPHCCWEGIGGAEVTGRQAIARLSVICAFAA